MGSLSTERLVKALVEADAPNDLVRSAAANYFHDFLSPSATPISDLVKACEREGLHDIASRARYGEFDSGKDEAHEWAKSDEGKAAMKRLSGAS